MNVLTLSRIQFAITIGFHYLYPPLSIGLGVLIVIMEGLYLNTRKALYQQMARFWVRIFSLTFAVGVATGIVMEFEFGTNWATYSRYVGDVFGSALAAEGIFAFFLESGFLALLLFGWNRLSPRLHFLSAFMVMLGAHFSAIWIVVANSWMQTPAGFHIVGQGLTARAEIVDFWSMVFNPSSVIRLTHVLFAAWQTGAFFVMGIGATYLLRRRHQEFATLSIKIALVVAFLCSWGQLVSGHSSAKLIAKYQPAKLAAFEGHYEDKTPGILYLFGWVDQTKEQVHGLGLPGFLSLLLHGDRSAPVTGLRAFPPEDRPPVNTVFQGYHMMVGQGMSLILVSTLGLFLWWRKKLLAVWYQWVLVWAMCGPMFGNQFGWMAAEVGRQPWIVQGLLRTSQALSKVVTANQVLASLILFSVVYIFLFIVFLTVLIKKIKEGPLDSDLEEAKRFDSPSSLWSGHRA